MTISELSEKTGVSPRMLRYFEQHQLLNPGRGENKYRTYSEEHQNLVLKICDWQRMGLTLREIKTLQQEPEKAESVISEVFHRERQNFLLKQKSLEDLRERLSGDRHPYFEQRVAYRVPGLEELLEKMETQGFPCKTVDYIRFSEMEMSEPHLMIGEMIHQSAFFLLGFSDESQSDEGKSLMARFCKAGFEQWGIFDGHPPQTIEREDLGLFFAPGDLVMCLSFEKNKRQYSVVLPYQVMYAMGKASQEASR